MIVSKQRSGTNHFVSLLKSHPQVACYGEIFRDGFRVEDLIGKEFANYQPIEPRKDDPNRFLDDLEDFVRSDSEVLGFKVFPSQFLPVSQIAHRPGMQIIRLVRPNLLATYSSSRIAKLTGQGSATVGQEVKRIELDFDAEDFERFAASQASMDERVKKALEVIPEDRIFDMKYSDLSSETVLESVLDFLGVQPRLMTSNTQKRNSSRIVDRFRNPDTVMDYLERHQLTDWVAE